MNEALSHFHFMRPAALLLLPLGWLVWWWWRKQADPLRGWRECMDPELLQPLTVTGGGRPGAAWLLPAAWSLAALAIAGPTWRPEPNPFAADSAPLVILLKADRSMDAPDPPPSRAERARLKIADLAVARGGQPLGLIAYAGSAHLVLPPTRDTSAVADMAAEIDSGIMPEPGDRLDLALAKAAALLKETGGYLLVIAGSSATDPGQLKKAGGPHLPIQILAVNTPGSDDAASLGQAARTLDATLVPLAADSSDIGRIVAGASGTPRAAAGEAGTRWEEAGYWLVPAIALLAALSFRRETLNREAEA